MRPGSSHRIGCVLFNSLMGGAAQVLLQGNAPLIDLLSRLAAYISGGPRLIYDAGNVGGAVGIAENKAVAPAIGHEPLLGGHTLLGLVQVPIVSVDDIHRQAQLMLTGAGNSHFSCS